MRNRLYSVRFITRGADETFRVARGITTGVVGLALAAVVTSSDTVADSGSCWPGR